jgi:hypothetical protein
MLQGGFATRGLQVQFVNRIDPLASLIAALDAGSLSGLLRCRRRPEIRVADHGMAINGAGYVGRA